MTKDDWERVQKRLVICGFSVDLMCDAYRLTIQRVRVKEMRDALMVYVNGRFEWKWTLDDCEERRRFLRQSSCHVWPRKVRDKYGKSAQKRLKAIGMDVNKKGFLYSPYWYSFNAMRRHLVANNNEISLWVESAADDGGNDA